jgi:predicted NUDIX family NTP pyrophosphohydrolase
MGRTSSGLLMFRRREGRLEVLLAHPGGPYWHGKDDASWTIPKGEVAPGEELLDAAKREFEEETGVKPAGPFIPLTPVKQKAGKTVHAWAFEGDCDASCVVSNTYRVEWPPKSGQWQSFPEIDRAEFFDPETARRKINPAQAAFVEELERLLGEPHRPG